MNKSNIEIPRRIINYALCILIIHLGCNILMKNIFSINLMQELKDNLLFSIAVAFLLTYRIFIKDMKKDKKTMLMFGVEILILASTIDIKFTIFSELILIFVKSKENKQEDIINKNIKEYFKNKNK